MVRLVCFPWAGGTSRLFSSWKDKDSTSGVIYAFKKKMSNATPLQVDTIDYPGRIVRPNDAPIADIPHLASFIVQEYFPPENTQDVVLFGHSFGAIVAFEVARILEARGHPPLALIVSASRAPSASSLTSASDTGTPVSAMDLEAMVAYFGSRGNSIDSQVLMRQPEVANLFVSSVRLDYHCLEHYTRSDASVNCPLFVFGGDLDPGVSTEDLKKWESHASSGDDISIKVLEGQGQSVSAYGHLIISSFMYHSPLIIIGPTFCMPCTGHYYLNDPDTTMFLSDFVAQTTADLLRQDDDPIILEELVQLVTESFSKVLSVDASTIDKDSHFFYLGGTSLDTMTLTMSLKAALGIHVTQDEFFKHPTVEALAIRIKHIQESSSGVPLLVPIPGSDGTTDAEFPASHGQEQMVSCWEMSPTMYNMQTTVVFEHEAIKVDSMRKAFRYVVEQQPVLRTIIRIDPVTNEVYQRVLPTGRDEECFELKIVDVNDDEAARSVIEAESVSVFDLTRPPVVKGVLVRVSSGSEFLLLNQHHVGSDGWSVTILRRQILKAYLSFMSGNDLIEDTDMNVPVYPNFVDWTMWSRRWLFDYGQQERQLEY